QDAIDDWVRSVHLPVRLTLTPSGVHARTSLAGVSLSEVDCELEVRGPFLGLRPQRASMLGVPAPIVGMFRGYLPLPPLPMGARLQRVDPDHGRLTAWFSLDDVDEPLTPRVARVLQRRLSAGLRWPRARGSTTAMPRARGSSARSRRTEGEPMSRRRN